MSFFKRTSSFIRARLGQIILRGGVLRLWLERYTDILGRVYESFLASYFRNTPESSMEKHAVPDGMAVNELLFVCCNMWEKRELLPELQKLARVTFLDLNDCYSANPDQKNVFCEEAWHRKVQDLAKNLRFDAAVVYLDSQRLAEPILQWVRTKTDGPVFGLNLDDKVSYAKFPVFRRDPQDYKRWANKFDFNLSNSRAFVDIYMADGYRCLYLPTGYHYDHTRHLLPQRASYSDTIAFVGSRKPERAEFIDRLRELGVPVKLYGSGWEGEQFSDDGSSVYRSTQINLGIGFNLPGKQFTNLKNRDFECPGSGGCYLTTFDWELAELYDVGREILCYRSLADFCEIYLYYSRRPEACWKIARAGFERARREHTWAHRFAAVFRQAGINPNMISNR